MNAAALSLELNAIQTRTRRGVGLSLLIHALLLLWVILHQTVVAPPMGITEITWLDPVEIEPTPKLVVNETAKPFAKTVAKPKPLVRQAHFARETREADTAPRPQSSDVAMDKLTDRLSSLQRDAKSKKTPSIQALTPPNPVGRPALAGADPVSRPNSEVTELTRRSSSNPKPIELRRTKSELRRPVLASSMAPKPVPTAPTRAQHQESTAERVLGDARLTGEVADRPLVSYDTPIYPEWAKEEAVEGSVTIYFIVLRDGRVKKNVIVQKTSGFEDFDQNAVGALREWRFAPLKGLAAGEQWGTITFHYRLESH
jgi:TonB family protein